MFNANFTSGQYYCSISPLNRLWIFMVMMLFASYTQAQVSGTTFRDFNANGVQDTPEPTVSGIAVTAYDAAGLAVASTTSNSSGTYNFTGLALPLRIEFTGYQTDNYATAFGNGNATSVQFYSAATTTANFGISYPPDYCQTNPPVVTNIFVESNDGAVGTVVKFSYLNEGTAAQDKTTVASVADVGASVWGKAYSKNIKKIFTAASLKAHIPLGTAGLDAIYLIDPFSGTSNAEVWLELTDDLSIPVSPILSQPQYYDNATRGLLNVAQNDANAFVDVGKVGIGDIELSPDETILYVVNIYDNKLYAISTADKSLIASYTIPNPGCNNGQARPWALGQEDGVIYVGVTCDGSGSGVPSNLADNSGKDNLSATVYRLDGASFTQVLNFPLNYEREPPFRYSGGCDAVNYWKPWTDVVPATCADGNIGYPTPLLMDIEFADNGDMILGFTDRTGFQFGYENYGLTGTTSYSMYAGGEILKACKNGTSWAIENTTTGCSSPNGLAINTFDFDGYPMSWGEILDKPGEFYWGDYFHNSGGIDGNGLSYFPGHGEITLGALAVLPHSGEVMSIAYDPVTGADNYNTGGVISLNNTTGMRARNGYQLYATASGGITQGKGVGFGDIELLCDGQPLQIGNRVWNDTDSDGIQDADEAGLDGIIVTLYKAGIEVSSTTTANGGQWYFNNLDTQTEYEIKILGVNIPSGKQLTTVNANTNNEDFIDNDANQVGSDAVIVYTTGTPGQNNHSLDFGFKTFVATCSVTVDSAVPTACAPATNTYDLAVTVTYANPPTGDIYINVGGTDHTFTPDGTSSDTYTITGLASNGTAGIDVSATFVGDATCTHTLTDAFDAPVSCSCSLTATATGTDVLCNGGSNGTASATASGNIGAVTYLWSNGETTASISNLVADTYSVTISESASCTAIASYTVGEPALPLSLVCDKTDVTSNGGSDGTAIVTASGGTSPYAYLWDDGETTASLSDQAAGNYTVTVTDNNACTATCSSTINEPNAVGSIGNYVWLDLNLNGIQDEPASFGINGIDVQLWNAGSDGAIGGGDDSPIGVPIQTTNDSNGNPGYYYFVIDNSGYYYVQFSCPILSMLVTTTTSNVDIVANSPVYPINVNGTGIMKDNPTLDARVIIACLLINAGLADVACNNNGTDTDASDDYISFTLDPSGTDLGSNYTVSVNSGGITPSSGVYGLPTTFQLQNGSAGSGNTITVTIADNTGIGCSIQIDIADTGSCSMPDCPTVICTSVTVTKN